MAKIYHFPTGELFPDRWDDLRRVEQEAAQIPVRTIADVLWSLERELGLEPQGEHHGH